MVELQNKLYRWHYTEDTNIVQVQSGSHENLFTFKASAAFWKADKHGDNVKQEITSWLERGEDTGLHYIPIPYQDYD